VPLQRLAIILHHVAKHFGGGRCAQSANERDGNKGYGVSMRDTVSVEPFPEP
jgi:hypothetical protein